MAHLVQVTNLEDHQKAQARRGTLVENVPPKGKRCLQVTSSTLNTIKVNGRSSRNTITLKVFVISI